MASPTSSCISSTENPFRTAMPSSAADRTRSALAPRRTNSICQNADLARSRREMSPRFWNDGASASAEERRISVRSRSKNAAAVTSGDERQRAREAADALLVDRPRDADDRLRRLVVGISEDERHTGVARRAQRHGQRHTAEHGDTQLRGEAIAPAGAEHLRRHVLDDADEPETGLLRHRRRARRDLLRERLWRR